MIESKIRKNIVTNKYEHYVPYGNGYAEHWAPGIVGNDTISNDVTGDFLTKRDSNDYILSYDGLSYKFVSFTLTVINTELEDKEIKELVF